MDHFMELTSTDVFMDVSVAASMEETKELEAFT